MNSGSYRAQTNACCEKTSKRTEPYRWTQARSLGRTNLVPITLPEYRRTSAPFRVLHDSLEKFRRVQVLESRIRRRKVRCADGYVAGAIALNRVMGPHLQ